MSECTICVCSLLLLERIVVVISSFEDKADSGALGNSLDLQHFSQQKR